MSSLNSSALRFVCGDLLPRSAEATLIRQALNMPARQIYDLEAWHRERGLLVDVSDEDYQQPRLSVIG